MMRQYSVLMIPADDAAGEEELRRAQKREKNGSDTADGKSVCQKSGKGRKNEFL